MIDNRHPFGEVTYVPARGTWVPIGHEDSSDPDKSQILQWIIRNQPLLNSDGTLLVQEGPPMRAEEVQLVLAKCAAFDSRRPDPATVLAWADALDRDVTVDDAIAAVTTYYAGSRERIMPSDVNAACLAMRAQRIRDEIDRKGPLLPDGLADEPALEARWRKESLRALGQGATREQARDYAWHAINMTPPPQVEAARRDVHTLTKEN